MKLESKKGEAPTATEDVSEKTKESKRRAAVRTILLSGAVVGGIQFLDQRWHKPLVKSLILPAHATTSVSDEGGDADPVPPPVEPPVEPPVDPGPIVLTSPGFSDILCAETGPSRTRNISIQIDDSDPTAPVIVRQDSTNNRVGTGAVGVGNGFEIRVNETPGFGVAGDMQITYDSVEPFMFFNSSLIPNAGNCSFRGVGNAGVISFDFQAASGALFNASFTVSIGGTNVAISTITIVPV